MTKYYAGFGAVKLPPHIPEILTKISAGLQDDGYTLRSPGDFGVADILENGCTDKEIYLPWPSYSGKHSIYSNPSELAVERCYNYINRFGWMPKKKQKLYARMVEMLLGTNLDSRCEFIMVYDFNDHGSISAEAIKIARVEGISVINLAEFNASRLSIMLSEGLS